jgi:hypothetical protein
VGDWNCLHNFQSKVTLLAFEPPDKGASSKLCIEIRVYVVSSPKLSRVDACHYWIKQSYRTGGYVSENREDTINVASESAITSLALDRT